VKRSWMAAIACIALAGCQWPESREVVVPDVRYAVDIGGPLIPAENVAFGLNGATIRSARLAAADQELEVRDDGSIVIPTIGLHDTLVLSTR